MQRRWLVATISVGAVLVVGAGVMGFRSYSAEQTRAAACADIQRTEARVDRSVPEGDGDVVAFLGDSYTQGMYLDEPTDAFPYEVAAALNARPLVNGSGGSGYAGTGPCRDAPLTARINDVVAAKPDVLIIQAGINDRGNADSAAAIEKVMTAAESVETVYVIGPFATPASEGAPLEAVATEIEDAAQRHGFTYIDASAWEFDLMADDLHPTPTGHHDIALELIDSLRE